MGVGMAITNSAKKAIRVSARKQVFNLRRLRSMRLLIKDVRKMNAGGDGDGAREKFREAQKAIDKAAKRGVIKARTAARRTAALARAIKPAGKGAGEE